MEPSATTSVPRWRAWLRRPAAVFWVFLAAYLFTWGGHYTTGDGAIKVAWARALWLRQSHDLDEGPGVKRSRFGIGHSLISLPAVAAADVVRRATGFPCAAPLYTLLLLVNRALFVYLVARYLWPHYPPRQAWGTVALLGFGSIWWPYTRLDFSEPFITTLLFGGFLLMRAGRPAAGMLVASFTITIRPDSLLWCALLGGWHLAAARDRRAAVRMAAAALPALGLHFWSVWVRYGSFPAHGYGETVSLPHPWTAGLFGQLLSPGKSVFLYSPVLLLGLAAWPAFRRRVEFRRDAWFFLGLFVAQVVFYAGFWFWSGDDAWGPRYILPATVLLVIPAVEWLSRRRVLPLALVAGIVAQLPAVIVGGLDYELMVRLENLQRPAGYNFSGTKRLDFDDVWYHPRYSQWVGNALLARHAVGWRLPHPRPLADAQPGAALTDIVPAEVWDRYARVDWLWLQVLRTAWRRG